MTNYNRAKLQTLISDENGPNYHKNVPLDGFTITLGVSFISFSFKEINGITVAVVTYMYITDKNAFINLLGYCIKIWSGYGVKMIYYKEHRRKSNIIKFLKYLDFDVKSTKTKKWKYIWKSTNGYKEDDCIEAYTKCNSKSTNNKK
jgi:hypothetical protein